MVARFDVGQRAPPGWVACPRARASTAHSGERQGSQRRLARQRPRERARLSGRPTLPDDRAGSAGRRDRADRRRRGGRGRRPRSAVGLGLGSERRPAGAVDHDRLLVVGDRTRAHRRGHAWGLVLVGRLVDRVGKAARTAPRDALIRDSSSAELVGASFGFHRALDTIGATIGPLVAVALLAAGTSLRAVLALSVVPGLLAVLLVRRVHEAPRRSPAVPQPRAEPRLRPGSGSWSSPRPSSPSETRRTRSSCSARRTSGSRPRW